MRCDKFFCKECNRYFYNPKYFYERHGLDAPPYEKVAVCPQCSSEDFIEFETLIEKTEVAQKLLPAIMLLNTYANESNYNNLTDAISMIAELICEMFDFLDYDIERKLLTLDNELDLEKIMMYLDGEL